MSAIQVLSKPMTLSQARASANEHDYFSVNVLVDLDDVIDCGDLDSFINNVLEPLIVGDNDWLMSDVMYAVIGAHEGDIVLNVEGCIETSSCS